MQSVSICWLYLGIAGLVICLQSVSICWLSLGTAGLVICLQSVSICWLSLGTAGSRYLPADCVNLLAISRHGWVSLFVCSLYQFVGYLKVQLDLVICLQSVSICWLSLGTAGLVICLQSVSICWLSLGIAGLVICLQSSSICWLSLGTAGSRYLSAVCINLLAISRYSWISLFVCSLCQSVGYL